MICRGYLSMSAFLISMSQKSIFDNLEIHSSLLIIKIFSVAKLLQIRRMAKKSYLFSCDGKTRNSSATPTAVGAAF